eukprot:1137557-Lingulodinium_polyedra.AAC.1
MATLVNDALATTGPPEDRLLCGAMLGHRPLLRSTRRHAKPHPAAPPRPRCLYDCGGANA